MSLLKILEAEEGKNKTGSGIDVGGTKVRFNLEALEVMELMEEVGDEVVEQ